MIQIWSRSPQEFEAAKSSKSTVRDFESRDLEVSQITLTFFADNTDIFESVYFRLSFYLVTGYVMRRMIATLGWIWTTPFQGHEQRKKSTNYPLRRTTFSERSTRRKSCARPPALSGACLLRSCGFFSTPTAGRHWNLSCKKALDHSGTAHPTHTRSRTKQEKFPPRERIRGAAPLRPNARLHLSGRRGAAGGRQRRDLRPCL